MISTTEDTADIAQFFILVAQVCQVIAGAFDASWSEVSALFGIQITKRFHYENTVYRAVLSICPHCLVSREQIAFSTIYKTSPPQHPLTTPYGKCQEDNTYCFVIPLPPLQTAQGTWTRTNIAKAYAFANHLARFPATPHQLT
jgi:hypothetical protein